MLEKNILMADILEQLNKLYNPWHADDESSISQGEAEAWRLYQWTLTSIKAVQSRSNPILS